MTHFSTTERSANWDAYVSIGDKRIRYAFDNKWAVSLIWGDNTYGDANEFGEAVSYEVAVFKPDGEFLSLTEYDDVIGHRTWNEVKHILEKVNTNHATDLELTY